MNKLSFVGVFIILFSISFTQMYHGSSVSALFDLPALVIVLGGTIGAILIQTSARQFFHALSLLPSIFLYSHLSLAEQSKRLHKWSEQSRKKGLLTLENENLEKLDHFTQKSIEMLVDGCDEYSLQDILQQDIELECEHNERSAQIYESMGGYSPTIGIIGAVLGLIQAMNYLDKPDQLGAGIAVAFLATIYGVGFANFLFLPIANKIRLHYQYVALYREMTLVGILAILKGENSLLLERRLQNYIDKASY